MSIAQNPCDEVARRGRPHAGRVGPGTPPRRTRSWGALVHDGAEPAGSARVQPQRRRARAVRPPTAVKQPGGRPVRNPPRCHTHPPFRARRTGAYLQLTRRAVAASRQTKRAAPARWPRARRRRGLKQRPKRTVLPPPPAQGRQPRAPWWARVPQRKGGRGPGTPPPDGEAGPLLNRRWWRGKGQRHPWDAGPGHAVCDPWPRREFTVSRASSPGRRARGPTLRPRPRCASSWDAATGAAVERLCGARGPVGADRGRRTGRQPGRLTGFGGRTCPRAVDRPGRPAGFARSCTRATPDLSRRGGLQSDRAGRKVGDLPPRPSRTFRVARVFWPNRPAGRRRPGAPWRLTAPTERPSLTCLPATD